MARRRRRCIGLAGRIRECHPPLDGGCELPEGFPEDFPIYEKATITAARRIDAAQGSIYAIGMETTDGADAVRSFYEARLAEAPWEVSNVVEISEENTVVVSSRGETTVVGGDSGHPGGANGRAEDLIAVSLPAPAASVTPTPVSSRGRS